MSKHKLLVFQTDFGRLESTVAEMYGVALGVDPTLIIHETTHNIPQFNIREASFRLFQAVPWWPEGTVFVSVVDPGVGSSRRSVVAETTSGHYVVTPDNGSLTHLFLHIGIKDLRIIDEEVNRLQGSAESQTFHGRDVYGYTGARLASGIIDFEEVGPRVEPNSVLTLSVVEPSYGNEKGGAETRGAIEILDLRYGNVWTNIPLSRFTEQGFTRETSVEVKIYHKSAAVYRGELPYRGYFSSVAEGEDLVYTNELLFVALGTNQGSFALKHGIEAGPDWTIRFRSTGVRS